MQPKVTKKVTSFSGCKVLKNAVIIRVRDNNRKRKFAENHGKNNQMHPLFLKLHPSIKECKTSKKLLIIVCRDSNRK